MDPPSPTANVHSVYVALGSNLGNKRAFCRSGLDALAAAGCRLKALSRYYLTAPVDYLDQGWFLNAAVKIETRLPPERLLCLLQRIQSSAGRDGEGVRFGPRTLDLDIIFYGDLILKTEALEIPHPRMHKRRFVLRPLCDIEPAFIHPLLGKNIRQLLDELNDPDQRIMLSP